MFFIFIILFQIINSTDISKEEILSYFEEYNKYSPFPDTNSLKNLTFYYENIIKNFTNQTYLNYNENPLITVIIPIYNGNQYILRALLSIEAQTFKNIEILYIDDYSTDNSTEIIQILQKIDKKIRLIKNKENKGILYSKSLGVKYAKGKYTISMDQDDLYINKNLFNELFNISEKNYLDIIQYKHIKYNLKENKLVFERDLKSPNYYKIIKQPELGNTKYFLRYELFKSYFLWDKLIKKEIYLKALNLIGEEILNKKIVHREDHIATFYLYKAANKYMRINLYGYLHIYGLEQQSSIYYFNTRDGKNVSEEIKETILRDQFEFFKFLYLRTKNLHSKNFICLKHIIFFTRNLSFCTKVKKKEIRNLVIDVCKMYINLNFISSEKTIIENFLKKFIEMNNELINHDL